MGGGKEDGTAVHVTVRGTARVTGVIEVRGTMGGSCLRDEIRMNQGQRKFSFQWFDLQRLSHKFTQVVIHILVSSCLWSIVVRKAIAEGTRPHVSADIS